VNTAAFNLPNDERVVQEKGSKRTMLKNVQEAKFEKVLLPIARIALSREVGSYAAVSMEASNLSMVERQLGNLEQAEALAREALDIFWKRQDHWAVPYGLNSLSAVARDRGQLERAATIIGAAETMMQAQGAAWPPDERVHYEQTLTTLSQAMSPGDFERARAKGLSMSASEAVAFALKT